MIEINLTLFPGSQFHDVYKFVMQKTEFKFRILIARQPIENMADPHFCFAVEYGMAAYAGEQLATVSTDFSYNVPSPYNNKHFCFELETIEPELFVDVLYKLLCAYNRNFNCRDRKFEYEAAQFYRQVCEGTTEPQTWGLLDILDKHLTLAGSQFNKK